MTTYAYGGDPTGLSGKYHYGSGALGIRGALIPSTGTHGPGYVYPSLNLPTDANNEYYGVITSIPVGLTIDASEDSGFEASAADGTYVVPFDLVQFGANLGSTVMTLVFGDAIELTVAATTQTASCGTGTVEIVPAEPRVVNIVGADTVQAATSGAGTVIITSFDPGIVNLSAASCVQTATCTVIEVTSIIFARAPAGSGYAPKRLISYTRPAAKQDTDR